MNVPASISFLCSWFRIVNITLILTLFGLDPYLNTDAGTMSPFEHGEVFVLDDGGEVHREISSLFISCCPLENISVFPFFFQGVVYF